MGPVAAALAPVGAGLIGSIFGASNQSSAVNQANQAAQQAATGQTAIDQQLAQIYNQLFQQYQTSYQPLVSGVTGNVGSLSAGAAPGGADLGAFLQLLTNPSTLESVTGIPLQQGQQGAYNYFGTPGSTNLSQVSPQISSLLNQTMQTGISPDLISQALAQNTTASQQQIANIRNQLGAGIPNLSGTLQDLSASQFGSNAALLAQIAGQSQGLKLQAGQQLATQAGALDTQTANMLLEALGIGNTAQQQQLSNFGTATSTSSGIDQMVQQIINSGLGMSSSATSGLGQIGQQYAAAGTGAAQNANNALLTNPFAGLSSAVAGIQWPTPTPSPAPSPAPSGTVQLSGEPTPSPYALPLG